ENRIERTLQMTRWRALLSWLVILSLVTFVVYRNTRPKTAQDENEVTIDDIRIRVMGEELIGIKSLGSLAGQLQTAKLLENQNRMLAKLDEAARTPSDRMHIAIIAG